LWQKYKQVHSQRKLFLLLAFLMSLMVNLPNILLLLRGANLRFLSAMDWGDMALKIGLSFLYAVLILLLNTYKNWTLVQKIAYFALIHIVCTVFFIQFHGFLGGILDQRNGLRLGYHMRGLLLLIMSLVLSNYLKSNREKQFLALKNKSLEAAHLKSQLDALQQQLNPHFLFNSLNSLQSLMREDIGKSQLFVEHLSAILRYSLEVQQKKLVPFEKEMQLLTSYLYLLNIRFGTKLTIEYHNLDFVKGFMPPLALQLLVENAVNHNEISSQHPLSISIFFEEKNKVLSVKNTLKPKRTSTLGAGLGLYNLSHRYELLCRKSIEILKTDTHFEVRIPIIAHENITH
jgi:sensor histidine kinase YesM